MAHIVKALMVYVNRLDGTTVPVMRDGVVPEDVKPEHLAHLLGLGLVTEGDPIGGLPKTHPGDGSEDAGDNVDDVDGDGPIPAKSALKDEWVTYAVSQGADQTEAEASTKDDLIATYGG